MVKQPRLKEEASVNKPFSAVTQVFYGYTYNQVKAVVEVLLILLYTTCWT